MIARRIPPSAACIGLKADREAIQWNTRYLRPTQPGLGWNRAALVTEKRKKGLTYEHDQTRNAGLGVGLRSC